MPEQWAGLSACGAEAPHLPAWHVARLLAVRLLTAVCWAEAEAEAARVRHEFRFAAELEALADRFERSAALILVEVPPLEGPGKKIERCPACGAFVVELGRHLSRQHPDFRFDSAGPAATPASSLPDDACEALRGAGERPSHPSLPADATRPPHSPAGPAETFAERLARLDVQIEEAAGDAVRIAELEDERGRLLSGGAA